MPILIVNESYNGQDSLIANAGNWVDGEMNFSVRFAVGSTVSSKITWKVQGSNMWFQLQQGDFGDLGFLAADTVTASYTFYAAPTPMQAQSFTFTVDYIAGNKMYVTAPFGLNPAFGSPFTHIDGRQFPTDNYVGTILIVADRSPASAEFEFNLTPNGSTLLNSLIDSELNRFELPVVTGITTLVPQAMTQFINKSGGLLKDVDFTLMATPGGGWRDYRVRYKFFQWGIIQDGFTEPGYYALADCLAPINRIKCFAQYGNPNGVMIDKSENIEANTGGYDENFNGVASLYTSLSTSWVDLLGDPIDRLDYSNKSTFTAIIEAPNQANPNSTYRVGLAWRPIDGTYYQNKVTHLGENLLVIAPEIDFIANGVADPAIYQGYEDENGARWDFQNLKFELTGVDELTVSGDIIPNALATILFDGISDGGRRSTLWVDLGDHTSDGTVFSNRVSLKIFDDDNYDAPTKGVQIPNVIDEALLDHAGKDITTPDPQTTTEDDVLYVSNFNLLDNLNYEGVRARIYAYNSVTEEAFTLENIFFNFANAPLVAGQFQPDFINPRGFNLPPTSDRNHISLVRNPLNDVPGQYGLTIEYGYLSDWRYWLSQPNVDNDFFDANEPLNGKNRNWQRFSNSGDWDVRLSYYTRLDGVDDFNDLNVGIRPYEDDPDITTGVTFEIVSSGVFANDLVADEIMEVTRTLTWATGTYTNAWGEIIIEDFESGNTWWLSSVLPQGNITANPLKPLPGEVGLQITHPAPNIAVLKFRVDANIISAQQESLSYRIYSDDVAFEDYIIKVNKEAEFAFSLRKVSTNAIYPDASPCIKVRESGGNTELDIGFTGTPLAVDQVALLAHTGANDGFIVTAYDQSGNNNHANQAVLLDQQRIVSAGVVELVNGKPCFDAYPSGVLKAPLDLINNNRTFKTALTVAKIDVQNTINFIIGDTSNRGIFQNGTFGGVNGYGAFDGLSFYSLGGEDLLQHSGYINMRSGNLYASVDGAAETNLGASAVEIIGIDYIGGKKIGTNLYLRGKWQEIIVFNADRSADKASFEANINNFYSIY